MAYTAPADVVPRRVRATPRVYEALDGMPVVRTTPQKLDLHDCLKIVSGDVPQSTLSTRYAAYLTTLKDAHKLLSDKLPAGIGNPDSDASTAAAIADLDAHDREDVEKALGLVRLMPPGQVEFVRWKGDRTGNRMVVPSTWATAFLTTFVKTSLAYKLRAALIYDHSHMAESLRAARDAEQKAVSEASTANDRVVELEAQAASAQQRIAALEEGARRVAADDSVAQIDALEVRLGQLRDAEVAAEDAMCLAQLRVLFRRVGAPWLTRDGFRVLYLGQHREILEHFARNVTVSRAQMTDWLRDHPTGKRFWLNMCASAGLPVAPFDAACYEIEHILNAAWGGCDHPLNYMILWRDVNNSVEFRCGPCHLKMIMLGRQTFEAVQRFARWNASAPSTTARSVFTHGDAMAVTGALSSGSLRQSTIKSLCGKRLR